MKLRRTATTLSLSASLLAVASPAFAQAQGDEAIEEIVVTGIRGSLASALEQKRLSDNLVEVVIAEDIGKLPDQNLAEVLENVPGVQITRTAGVGTGVQIRGTNANRTEINGVSTVGSGSGRSGIDFEDLAAAIIASVEVTKAPEAKTIEGSVGGTVNLRTIRPLELSDTLAQVRVQGGRQQSFNRQYDTQAVGCLGGQLVYRLRRFRRRYQRKLCRTGCHGLSPSCRSRQLRRVG